VLLEAGADIDAVDDDGNSPLHVMCYGEEGNETHLDCIEILVSYVYLVLYTFYISWEIERT
jgi:ankyrin repeat protein